MKIINPATSKEINSLEEDGAQSIKERVVAAHAAQNVWKRSSYSERNQAVARFNARVQEDKEALSLTLTRETGKPIRQARAEIETFGQRVEYFLSHTQALLTRQTAHEDTSHYLSEQISFEPLGVVANISAWNYPYFVGGNVFVPALLTGNAVLYKPSEFASLTGLRLVEHAHRAGVPSDCFQAVIGGGHVGQALVAGNVNGVFFTGSYETGARIASAVASRMLPLGLELGGKDPAYVAADADLSQAAVGLADGAFYNTGQSCCAVERIYVHRTVYDPFLELFLQEVARFKLGDPEDEATYIGPLTRGEAQLMHLEAQVKDALEKGARLVAGGKRVSTTGHFFEPTVLTDVSNDMLVMREESFGPIIGVMRVRSDAEAGALMADTEYGLTASVFSTDASHAESILSELEVGSAYINCCDRVSPHLPWSGRRHSGLGSTLSTQGIQAFLRPKAWHIKMPPKS